MSFTCNGIDVQEVTCNSGGVQSVTMNGVEVWSAVPAITSYISFIEENNSPFTLKTYNTSKNWDGTLYYSTDAKNWNEWNGTEISSSADGKLYIRGKNNTYITGEVASIDDKSFVLTSDKRIQCLGNIENLLDYEIVKQGNHPVMAEKCYGSLFNQCTSLITAPELPATTLAVGCYYDIFANCESLIQGPSELPATTLVEQCYRGMFYYCTSLTQAPELPVTTLAEQCYSYMFTATSLTQAPALPATALADSCYTGMFLGCKSLTQAPTLPATTLASGCYYRMFSLCESLTQAPTLPATTLANECYRYMFLSCTSLTGKIHCARSTSGSSYKLTSTDIYHSSATIVFDL